MTSKKLALIITALCLAAGIALALFLALGKGSPPEAGSARFVFYSADQEAVPAFH